MNGSSLMRRGLKWTAAVSAALIVLVAVLAAALDAGYFRAAFIRFLEARSGRQIQVKGPLEVRIFSLSPTVIAENVAIGNPPWMPPGLTAEIGRISLVFATPRVGRW